MQSLQKVHGKYVLLKPAWGSDGFLHQNKLTFYYLKSVIYLKGEELEGGREGGGEREIERENGNGRGWAAAGVKPGA